ncbi:cbb3-type cytochrome c oxidase subunit I [Lentisalinibacter salinarum]|uniref:cbb3-type cytochrome c oxidase subunit I n=1 Tax=Lentisalinibacter salinarum TaxID=2992239 RepID=UPI00386723A2
MSSQHYELIIPDSFLRGLARAWIFAAVSALLLSGLFVLLIVASRTPGTADLFPLKNFFHLAIVVHVDLSVLVWFAAFGAALWTVTSRPRSRILAWGSFGIAVGGAVLLALSPFRPGEAIMTNYVPVLENSMFLVGVCIFAAGIFFSALRSLLFASPLRVEPTETAVMRFGVQTGVIGLVLSCFFLLWSYLAMPDFLAGAQYYEVLFWGGGHVLQFAWVQLMLVVWLRLAGASGIGLPIGPRFVRLLLFAGILPAFLAFWGYFQFDVGSPEHRRFFIWLMAAGGGLAAGPLGLAMLHGWHKSASANDRRERGLRAALLFSVVLFGVGGVLGFFINESNTIIPAHYHGCIVAITLAFMALTLHLLPRLGFAQADERLMIALPWTYGTGQLLHVAGLAFAGGHGVQRKTAGAEQGLEGIAQIAGMAVMGLGGLIAIVGGVLFLAAFLRSVLTRRSTAVAGTLGQAG